MTDPFFWDVGPVTYRRSHTPVLSLGRPVSFPSFAPGLLPEMPHRGSVPYCHWNAAHGSTLLSNMQFEIRPIARPYPKEVKSAKTQAPQEQVQEQRQEMQRVAMVCCCLVLQSSVPMESRPVFLPWLFSDQQFSLPLHDTALPLGHHRLLSDLAQEPLEQSTHRS
eukprot:SAG31_NODE_5032_length_2791_cov_3.502972_2_plen_165_part_00